MISLTYSGATVLEQDMKANPEVNAKNINPRSFHLRVDWVCHHAYGSKVAVELVLTGNDHPSVIHKEADIGDAVAWAGKWLRDRGFRPFCNVGWHEHMDHKYLDILPAVPEVNPHPRWEWVNHCDCAECARQVETAPG